MISKKCQPAHADGTPRNDGINGVEFLHQAKYSACIPRFSSKISVMSVLERRNEEAAIFTTTSLDRLSKTAALGGIVQSFPSEDAIYMAVMHYCTRIIEGGEVMT